MKNLLKKIIVSFYILFILGSFFIPNLVSACGLYEVVTGDTCTKCPAPAEVIDGKCVSKGYQLLAPIKGPSGDFTNFNPGDEHALGHYLNILIKILIGLAAVMAVV